MLQLNSSTFDSSIFYDTNNNKLRHDVSIVTALMLHPVGDILMMSWSSIQIITQLILIRASSLNKVIFQIKAKHSFCKGKKITIIYFF